MSEAKKRPPPPQAESAWVMSAIAQVISYNHKDRPKLADTPVEYIADSVPT